VVNKCGRTRIRKYHSRGQKIRSRYFRTKPMEILKTSKKKKLGKAHSNRNAKQDNLDFKERHKRPKF